MVRQDEGRLIAWAFIPARGGSKSIPLKNLVTLGDRALLDYSAEAAKASKIFERIICSTDHSEIAKRSIELGLELDVRSEELSGDEVSTRAVIIEFLGRQKYLPDVLFIIEPTSPFVRPDDIIKIKELMEKTPNVQTGMTICEPPHTHHAWNQREIKDGLVRFIFEERKQVFAKQQKPALYIFGNAIACRISGLLEGADVFSEPSVGVLIERPYDVNIDDINDLILAEALYRGGVVKLPHLK